MTGEETLELLLTGEVKLLAQMPNASNYTFLVEVFDDAERTLAVYKPRAGEQPLWDFPDGTLCLREAAAYKVSEALGFGFVPPTVLREGPHGFGSVQQFLQAEPELHYLNLPPEFDDDFAKACAFDLLINNADRKSGHCLLEQDTKKIWLVDHGVCFHADPKLRTVIWDFAGKPIPPEITDAVVWLASRMPPELAVLLQPEELEALGRRAWAVARMKVFPEPGPGRPFPWPPV